MKWSDQATELGSGETSTARIDIDASLVRTLVASQFPEWAYLPIKPVAFGGWDNRTFHLGEGLTVRLPSAARYSAQVEKEQRWLPRLAPLLPLPIPVPLAMGVPAQGYPWHWSVYRWLEGQDATIEHIADLRQFALTLAEFLLALQRIDPAGGAAPGPHNFYRGGSLEIYDAQTRQAIRDLAGTIDRDAVTSVWDDALKASWRGRPVWLHGDVSAGNLLVTRGRLSAVIDFGSMGVGDPACDVVIAWTLFARESREAFRAALPLDTGTWVRGRGWALWKALITLVEDRSSCSLEAAKARQVVSEVVAEHQHA
jgi:aminoglycoside phosphotransferase (APT) family kinase protein